MTAPLVLIGFMCSGKTTVGQALAKKEGLHFVDTDHIVVKKTGMPIRDIFAVHGQDFFADCEFDAISDVILDLFGKKSIISVGGAAFTRPKTFDLLKKKAKTFYLKVPAEEVHRRLLVDDNVSHRPNIAKIFEGDDHVSEIAKMIKSREAWYDQADKTICCKDKTLEEIMAEILKNC